MRSRSTERLLNAGTEPSVGSVGDACDNALAESVTGLFKAEVIHRRALERISNIPSAEANHDATTRNLAGAA